MVYIKTHLLLLLLLLLLFSVFKLNSLVFYLNENSAN